jgi:HD-GYP domain-containing protein (c-di-GMP phosphodiesterase class II)
MSEETTEYQPNQTDEYVNHIAKVEDTNPTKAVEDIYNDQGILLLSKGSVITKKVAGLLVQHQLKKELDQSIHVSNTLTVYDILNQTLELIEKESELALLHQHLDFEVTLRQVLFEKPIPSQVLQRLTVMSRVMPEAYERSLFCSWFVPLICKYFKLPYQVYFSAHSAGLAHDIGLMHISEAAATDKHGLTYQQWRALKTHPIVARMILEGRKLYDEDMLNAVADHHERSDRSGYPAGKPASQLNTLSQLLGLADQLYGIYFDPEHGRRSILAWVPFLEVNISTFGANNSEALLALLKVPEITNHLNHEVSTEADVDQVLEQNKQVSELFSLAEKLNEIASQYPRSKPARGIIELMIQLRWVQDSAGFGSDHLSEWLEWSKENPDDSSNAELVEIQDLLSDLRWRFRRLWRVAVEFYWGDKVEGKHQKQVKKLFDQMTPLLPCPGRVDDDRSKGNEDATEPTAQ